MDSQNDAIFEAGGTFQKPSPSFLVSMLAFGGVSSKKFPNIRYNPFPGRFSYFTLIFVAIPKTKIESLDPKNTKRIVQSSCFFRQNGSWSQMKEMLRNRRW